VFDRGQLSPFIAMWMPNFVLGFLGIFLCIQTAKEQKFINSDFLKLFNFKSIKNND
jgi:hypothetical protein